MFDEGICTYQHIISFVLEFPLKMAKKAETCRRIYYEITQFISVIA